jgi:hypothetical protein
MADDMGSEGENGNCLEKRKYLLDEQQSLFLDDE